MAQIFGLYVEARLREVGSARIRGIGVLSLGTKSMTSAFGYNMDVPTAKTAKLRGAPPAVLSVRFRPSVGLKERLGRIAKLTPDA